MILLMPPYATTAAMVREVDFAMVVVKRSSGKALDGCFCQLLIPFEKWY